MTGELGEQITVHKLSADGVEVFSYQGRLLRRTDTSLSLEAYFNRDEVVVDELAFRRGDRMVESFYSDRWYNIFAVYAAEDDHLKAWYCNIARPARIHARHIFQEDLALDLIVYPDHRWRVMDRTEFKALDLAPKERDLALQALRDLQDLARRGLEPFKTS